MSKFEVGCIYSSNRYGDYCILEKYAYGKYKIRFVQTGFIKTVTHATLLEGAVRDPYFPIYYGVAYVGDVATKDCQREFRVWRAMISRCYDVNNANYCTYGAKGITVCDRWLCFKNFLEDITSIIGYNKALFDSGDIELDKDIKYKGFGDKQYGPHNCIFISSVDNFQEMLSRRKQETSSKYIGVTKLKCGKWQASISYKSKNIYIGRYNTEIEAHQAYIKKHKELYGNEVHCQTKVV